MLFFGMVILAGIFLRFTELNHIPYGIDADQARVLLTGEAAFREGRFGVYANESTRFEALPSYLFVTMQNLTGQPRVLAFLFSIADLILLIWLLRRRGVEWEWTFGAAALLAASPFAIYYARVMGPCVGASTLLLAYLLAESAWKKTAWIVTGLFYYSILRLIPIYEILAGAWRRDARRIGRAVFAILILALVSGIVGEFGAETKLRGGYNFASRIEEYPRRVVEGVRLWVASPTPRMIEGGDGLVSDPVSIQFAWLLGSAPAMGIGFSLLFILAVIQFGQDAFTRSREIGLKATVREWPRETKFFLFGAAALTIAPTYSHAIFLAPLAAVFAVTAFQSVARRHTGVRVAVAGAIAVSCWSGLVQASRLWQNLAQPGQYDAVFADRLRDLFESRLWSEPAEDTPVLFSAAQYDIARYWSSRPGRREVFVLPGMAPDDAMGALRALGRGPRIVYFDVQELNAPWFRDGAGQAYLQRQTQSEERLKEVADVVSSEDIHIRGQLVARRYAVRIR